MQTILKHRFLIGLIALAATASAGGAYAATESGTSSQQAFLNDVAKRLNVSPTQLRDALNGAFLDRLNAAVKAGKLTQTQADRLKQRLEQGGRLPFFFGPRGLGQRGFSPRGLGPGGLGPGGLGPGGPGPPGLAPRGQLGHAVGGPLGAAVQYLGLTPSQLMSALGSGQTLAQIAKAHGKSVSGLEQAMRAAVRSRLDRLMADGVITKAQEQRLLARMSARIARDVNRSLPRYGHLRGQSSDQGPPDNVTPFPGPGAPPPGGPAAGSPITPGGAATGSSGSPGGPPPAA